MSKLKVKGLVLYPPGPWGAFKPVENAVITITDVDQPGKQNDKIFAGTTDSEGRFGGTTKEWQDKIKVKYWKQTSIFPPIGHWAYKYAPDITDLMILTIKIEADGQEFTGSFPFVADDVEVPLIVPWIPPTKSAWATLNGIEFTDFQNLINELMVTIEAKDNITLQFYGEWAEILTPLVQIINTDPLELVQVFLPGSHEGSMVLVAGGVKLTISAAALAAGLGGIAAIVFALSGLVIASGAAFFLQAMGVALVLAVLSGYMEIEAQQTSTMDNDGNTVTETSLSLNNTGC